MKKPVILQTIGLIFLFFISVQPTFAQTPAYKATFDNYFNGHLGSYGNKVTVVVGCPQGILYEYNNGYNASSSVGVQSISKWLTSAIIMILEEENKLELDSTIGFYIPSWKTNNKQNVTLRQVLSHTSGIVDGTQWDSSASYTLEQAVDALATSTTLMFSPGSQFSYGSTSYKVAARVAEKVEGKTWDNIFNERLKTICGMSSSVFNPNAILNPATGRGLVTTRDDYANFLRMMLRFGMHNSTRVMDSVSIVEIARQSSAPNQFSSYGLGVWRENPVVNGVAQEIWHNGVDGALAWIDRTKGLFGLIITSAGQEATYSISQNFRQMTKDNIPNNSCGSVPQPDCDFAVTAANTNASPTPGATLNLVYNCTGSNCNTASFAWSGQNISGNQNPKQITAPPTAGTYTYQIAANKTGCPQKIATTQITVTPPTGGGCVVNKVRLQFRGSPDCCYERLVGAKIQGSNNGGSTWTDIYTFTGNGNGSFQDFTFSNTTSYSSARFVASATGWGELRELEFYNGTTKLTGTTFGTDNYANAFDGNTATEWHAPSTPGPNNYAGMNFTGCTTNCDFNVTASASPSSVAASGNVSLGFTCTGTNCNTASFAWSGQNISGNQNPKSITAPANAGTYTYTITATKTGCANKTATVNVVVNPTSGTGCTVNKVRFQFRQNGECCMDRLPGAKIQGSNNGTTWTDLYTFTSNGTGSWQEFTFPNTTSYSSVRFQASSTGWGELYELEFYKGSAKLTGTPFGIGNYANAFDGNLSTDWQVSSNPGTNNYAGLSNLGNCSGSAAVLDMSDAEKLNTGNINLTASPNPSKGELNAAFFLPRGEKATIVINDLQGRTIYRRAIIGNGQHNEKISLANKSSGTFVIRLETNNGVQVRKINIAR